MCSRTGRLARSVIAQQLSSRSPGAPLRPPNPEPKRSPKPQTLSHRLIRLLLKHCFPVQVLPKRFQSAKPQAPSPKPLRPCAAKPKPTA